MIATYDITRQNSKNFRGVFRINPFNLRAFPSNSHRIPKDSKDCHTL